MCLLKKYYLNFKRSDNLNNLLVYTFLVFGSNEYFFLCYLASSKGQTNLKQKIYLL